MRLRSLVARGDRVAVAVSGGSDSVALMHLLLEIGPVAGFDVAGIVHVNHGLRAEASDADEAFCRGLAAAAARPIHVSRVDAAGHAREMRRSVEVAARALRYRAFEAAAERLGATLVATGHTEDDQAETVLLRLLRGAGTRGLAGILARRGRFIRPLLECRRAELAAYLAERGATFREDASNADVAIPRNRVRHELMPVIERLSPRGVRALARCAFLAAEDEAYFRAQVIAAAGSVVLSRGAESAAAELDAAALNRLPAALARRLVRDLAEQVSGTAWAARHVDALRRLARADKPAGHLDLPGASADCDGRVVRLRAEPNGRAASPVPAGFEVPLAVPGQVTVPGGLATIAALVEPVGDRIRAPRPDVGVVQASALALPLSVRNRRAGDRIRPLGAPGSRKLQDVFVDRKVPRRERDEVPLVVDAAGRIVWVAGLSIAHECRVTDPLAGVVILELRR
jgi:tRNA(Ile)-lysidine synthase